jgi:glycosyltransferase involved in cell wall biosynthesis
MKLMQAIGGSGNGGAETFFVKLAMAFHQNGLHQMLATRANEIRDAQLRDAGIDLVNLKFGGKLDWQTPRRLDRMAQEYKPDIFLGWMSRAASMTPTGSFPKLARIGGYYKIKYFQKCDHLVCNTSALCRHMTQQGWPEDRIHYIPNFISWTSMPPTPRQQFATPDGVPLLLSLGRLHPVKGLDCAIRTIANIPDAHLWIAGTGPIERELKKLATDCGVAHRVRFLGWRTDKEALLAAADICLFPSRQEPFGNVILDAWASRTPIVATSAEGPAAYIQHGENGLLTPIDDVATMTAHVLELVNQPDLVRRLVAGGTAEYEEKFNETAALRNWHALFSAVG